MQTIAQPDTENIIVDLRDINMVGIRQDNPDLTTDFVLITRRRAALELASALLKHSENMER